MEEKSSRILLVNRTLYILAFLIGVTGKLLDFNYYLSFRYFNLFHIFMEMIFSVCAISIFFMMQYTYPYEKSSKQIIPGVMFLAFALLNTYHSYCSLDVYTTGIGFKAADITYLILPATLILSVVLPKKPSKGRNKIIIFTPLVCCMISIYYIFKIRNEAKNPIPVLGHSSDQIIFYFMAEIVFIITLIILHAYKNDKDEQVEYGIKSIMFLILAVFYFMLFNLHSDIYSVVGHMFKAISIFYMFNAFFVVNIRRPHESIREAMMLAEKSSNIKTDFIINLSHELRTPINIILNASKLIDCDEKSQKYLKSIEKGTERLNKVCESILEFNEIENGYISYNYENLDVVFLIDEILETAEETADSKNLDIQFDFESSPVVITDVKKFKIVVLNLVSNAIKYAPVNGSVKIVLDVNSDNLFLKIVNDGPNIPKDEVNRIFDKFYKIKNNDLESTEGLGIGLYISKGYADMLGGHIDVINDDDFTGYLFTLPIKKADEEIINIDNYNVKGFFSDIS